MKRVTAIWLAPLTRPSEKCAVNGVDVALWINMALELECDIALSTSLHSIYFLNGLALTAGSE